MKCIDSLDKVVRAHGGTLEWDGWDLTATAPAGYVWGANLATVIVEPCSNGDETWTVDACKAMKELVGYGVERDERSADELRRHGIDAPA